MEPTQIKMKIGWLFWIIPSVTWNAFINSLASSFDKPGITIIAYVRINPVAKAHNNKEKVMIVSGDKDFIQLHKYDEVNQYSPIQKKFVKDDDPKNIYMNR